tara:strand:- start:69 stop:1349 length:1281 start_codon:yes stop_codon:yes gene_type:complete
MIDKIVMSTMGVSAIIILIIALMANPTVNAFYFRQNKLTGTFFTCCIISFFIIQTFALKVNDNYKQSFTYAALLFFVSSFISGLYLYIKSFDLNDSILQHFKHDENLNKLQENHVKHVKKSKSLSKCVNFHDGSYYKEENLNCDSKPGCDIENICDENKGAKIVDFYIMSSNQSCLIPYVSGNYVSTKMLEHVISTGARFLDFDIYTILKDRNAIPVVKSEWLNKKSLNYVPLEHCFEKIKELAFVKHYKDPLFIHLNLKTNNIETLDRIANLFLSIFSGENMIGPGYSYKSEQSISLQPICKFFKKIIVVVSGNCENTLLSEIVNIHTSYNARVVNESVADFPGDPKEFAYDNQNILTILKPNVTKNLNPSRPFSHGCQFVMMNLWRYTKQVKTHANFFKNGSFVLKKIDLQEDRRPRRRHEHKK